MTHDDEVCLKLGREVVRMIRDVQTTAQADAGFARRRLTFPGGAVHLFVVNDEELADVFERAACDEYSVRTVKPPARN
jgi:hypothetical protein